MTIRYAARWENNTQTWGVYAITAGGEQRVQSYAGPRAVRDAQRTAEAMQRLYDRQVAS